MRNLQQHLVGIGGLRSSRIVLPDGRALPAPDGATITVTPMRERLLVAGTLQFLDAGAASDFAAAVETARRDALGSLATRIVLESLKARAAVAALVLVAEGDRVQVSTSVSHADGDSLLGAATSWAKDYFGKR